MNINGPNANIWVRLSMLGEQLQRWKRHFRDENNHELMVSVYRVPHFQIPYFLFALGKCWNWMNWCKPFGLNVLDDVRTEMSVIALAAASTWQAGENSNCLGRWRYIYICIFIPQNPHVRWWFSLFFTCQVCIVDVINRTHWWLAGWFIEGYQNINHQQPIGLW